MKFRKYTLILLFLLIATVVTAHQYAPDIIVTSPAGLWTDTRAYTNMAAAIAAVAGNERNLYIVRQEDFTGTVLATTSLNFMRVGSINATGAVTINTKSIIAGNRRIFFGAGALTFVDGGILKSAWFEDIDEAIAETNDDTVTILITQSDTAATNQAVGNDVTLKWDAPGNIISITGGVVVSNISSILAGDFEILTGGGRVDFVDGAVVWSTWFDQLRTVGRHIDDSRVVLEIRKEETLDYNYTFGADIRLDFKSRLTIPNGRTLTIYSPEHVIADPKYFIFNNTGTGAVTFTIGGIIYPGWWGAVGDYDIAGSTGTDDQVAIQAMFDSIHLENSSGFAEAKAAFISNIYDLDFGKGVYYISSGVTLGESGKYLYGVNLTCSRGCVIYSDEAGAGNFALEVTNFNQGKLDVHIISETGSALKIDTAGKSIFDLSVGGGGTYSLYTVGVIINNQWDRVMLSQNAYQNGADYGWYADYTFLTEDTWAGMPINNIDIIAFAGLGVGIHWVDDATDGDAGAITIGTIESEGTTGAEAMHFEGFNRPLVINNIWNESGAATFLNLIDMKQVKIGSFFGGGISGGRFIRIEDSGNITLSDGIELHGLNLVGTIDQLNLDNVQFISSGGKVVFTNAGNSQTYDNINNLKAFIKVLDTDGATINGYFNITNRSIDTTRNLITDPKGVDADGETTTTNSVTTEDGGHTDISPLGYRETLVEVDGVGIAYLSMNIDTTLLNEETTLLTLVQAWKVTNALVGARIVTTAGSTTAGGKWSPLYGSFHYYITDSSGNVWLLTATVFELDDGITAINLTWNYNTVYTSGDEFLFGGAVLYGGQDIRFP